MQPSIGRTVHYVDRHESKPKELVHRAAIIMALEEQGLFLHVFGPIDDRKLHNVVQDEGVKSLGTWHWPERVD